jgi:hypothetical protein
MARLRRFENHRYVGTRDDMVVYDCDDADQFATLEERIEADDLMNRDLLQAFGPDEPAEARNRGFRRAG